MKVHPNYLFVIFYILFTTKSTWCLQQPNLENLPLKVSVDYDFFTNLQLGEKSNQLQHSTKTGYYNSTGSSQTLFYSTLSHCINFMIGRPYSAFVAVFAADYFSFYPSVKEGCVMLLETSKSSSLVYDCEYATNGAFFTNNISTTGLKQFMIDLNI